MNMANICREFKVRITEICAQLWTKDTKHRFEFMKGNDQRTAAAAAAVSMGVCAVCVCVCILKVFSFGASFMELKAVQKKKLTESLSKSEKSRSRRRLSLRLAGLSWLQANPLVSSFQWHIHYYIEVVPEQDERKN